MTKQERIEFDNSDLDKIHDVLLRIEKVLKDKHPVRNNGWLKLTDAAQYADISRSTLSRWIVQGLRYVEIGGSKRTKAEWIDDFMVKNDNASRVLDEVIKKVRQKYGHKRK